MYKSHVEEIVKDLNGGRSSAGRALDCDSSGRGFEAPSLAPVFSATDKFSNNFLPKFFCLAGVVQLDRASDFESECWEFESLRPHQSYQRITQI